MKYLIFPLYLLFGMVMLSAQPEPLLLNAELQIAQTRSGLTTDASDQEEVIVSSQLSASLGFINSEFDATIEVTKGTDDSDLEIKSDYGRAMQFTVSNMEGIILKQGRFHSSGTISFGNLIEGRYAVYIFAGTTVVKAFVVEKQLSSYVAF